MVYMLHIHCWHLAFLLRNSFKGRKAKVQKEVQYTRDVMCLLSSFGEGGIKRRGKQRAQLVKLGLQGKVTFSSIMSGEEIMNEIRSAFTEAMGNDPSFPFIILQVSGCGTKTLAALLSQHRLNGAHKKFAKLQSSASIS